MTELMPPYVRQMVTEETELSEKIESLTRFLFFKEVVGWGDLDEEDINLMKQQRDAMLVYRGALQTRMVKAMKKIIKGVDGLGTGRQE